MSSDTCRSDSRAPQAFAFLEELQAVEEQNLNYTFIPTMTEMARSHRTWRGEVGLINKEMLSRHLKNTASRIYYIAGPPAMVKGLHSMLNDARIDDDDIRRLPRLFSGLQVNLLLRTHAFNGLLAVYGERRIKRTAGRCCRAVPRRRSLSSKSSAGSDRNTDCRVAVVRL